MKRCAVLIFVALVVFWAPPLFGQGEEAVEVPPITVTYTRTDRDPDRIPADVTVIEKDEIEGSGAESVPDLLRREAGITVTIFSGVDKFSSVGMRGFARGLETLVMINGVPLNTPTLGEIDWSIIPLSAVEKIEIVRGPGGVLYGDKAVAGVINVITKKTFEKPFLEVGAGGGTEGTFDSTLSMGYGNDWGRIALSGGYHYTDGYRDNNYYDHNVWSVSGGLTPGDIFEITLDSGYSSDSWGCPGALFDQQRKDHGRRYTNTPNDKGDGDNFYSLLGANLDLSEYGRIELDYAYKTNNTRSEYVYTDFGGYRYLYDTNLNEHDVSAKYILDSDFDDIDNRITLGVDYNNIVYTSSGRIPEWATWSDVDAKRDVVAGYAYDELTLFDRLIASLGYRYEYIDTSFDSGSGPPAGSVSLSEDFSEWALSAGLAYRYGDGRKAFFRFERGFRVPALDEIFQYAPPSWTLTNTHLSTEHVTSFEAGVEHAFSEKISARATLWWSRLENELYYDNLTFVNNTYDRTVHRGVDIGIEAQPFEFLSCSLAYGYQDAFFDASPYRGKTVPLIPMHTVSFTIGVDYKGVSLDVDGKYGSDRVRDGDFNNEYHRLSGYYVMNARMSYTYRHFEFFAGVKNLTDAYSADFGGYKIGDPRGFYYEYPNPGRTFYGGITMRF
jgi:iron complex outermembrane recepter protein